MRDGEKTQGPFILWSSLHLCSILTPPTIQLFTLAIDLFLPKLAPAQRLNQNALFVLPRPAEETACIIDNNSRENPQRVIGGVR